MMKKHLWKSSQTICFLTDEIHQLSLFIYLRFLSENNMLPQMLLAFRFFTSYISAKLVAFLHFIYVSSKLAASNVAFFLPLKYFVFWVKNYFRQKIYLRFFSEKQCAVLDVTSFFLFHVICFIQTVCFKCCLFLPYFAF